MDGVVQTTLGRVRGARTGQSWAFKGVSYGADTSGPGRFKPAEPAKPWAGVRDALAFVMGVASE